MDETAAARGQDYVSIFADMDRAAGAVRHRGPRRRHGGPLRRRPARARRVPAGRVTDTSSDMSAAYIAGIGEHLPNAAMTFDRFHVAAKLCEAVDAVRRDEVAARPRTQTHPLAVAEEPLEPDRPPAGRAVSAHPPLGAAGHRPGAALARGLPGLLRPARRLRRTTTCDAGATAPNAHGCNRSRTSSRPWNATGTASSPGTPAA